MGVAVPLTAIVLGLAAPSGATQPQTSDASALQAVVASCAGATTAAGDTHSRLEAMYCGINVVRRRFGLGRVRGSSPLNRSSNLKADAVRRCGFSHTPCGMPFSLTFRRAGYLPARAFAENLAWGQGELGSPVHARRFFGDVFQAFGAQARLALVRKGATPIGGLVALGFKDVLAVPWASCLRPYLRLCPNMLLYWEAIRTGCEQGFRRFDFGRSTRDSGTYRFKRQWGAREEPLFWYTVPTGRGDRRPRPSAARHAAFLAGSWRHLPLAVTRRLGPHIRKYLTQ